MPMPMKSLKKIHARKIRTNKATAKICWGVRGPVRATCTLSLRTARSKYTISGLKVRISSQPPKGIWINRTG